MTSTPPDSLWTGGLTPEHELFFADRPENPEMRESTSIWLFEENGDFAIPRVGIEGEAHSWGNRLYHANFAFRDGRVLHATGRGVVPSPIGPDGRPTLFGAGPITFRLIEPFRRWHVRFDGLVVDTHVRDQIAQTVDRSRTIPLRYEIDLEAAAPCWVQDLSPETVAAMTPQARADAESMGVGWRLEQLFRATGTVTVDGGTRDFRATGNRIKRQSVRPLGNFRGHCWQAAIFPDGRGFACNAYPPAADGSTYNDGYIYRDGRMVAARVVESPWLRRFVEEGDDVSFALKSELGTTRIAGTTALGSYRVNNQEMGGFNLQQGGARYVWDDQTAFGMIERSSTSAVATA